MWAINNPLHFLRWVVNEYLGSYYCLQDGRKRMIARNGNYWKSYKVCGTAMLLTPVDMFGGPKVKWDDTLQVQMLKWCYFHLKPVLEHLVKEPRLEFVHEKHLPWGRESLHRVRRPAAPRAEVVAQEHAVPGGFASLLRAVQHGLRAHEQGLHAHRL